MKKIFQKMVDRIHCIWIVLTRKEFVMFAYNKILKGETRGATAVISDIKNKDEERLFFEAIIEYLKQEFNENDNSDSLS